MTTPAARYRARLGAGARHREAAAIIAERTRRVAAARRRAGRKH